MKKVIGLPIGLLIVMMMALALLACTPAEEVKNLDEEAVYVDREPPAQISPEAEIGTGEAEAALFTVTEEEAIEMALAEVPGEFFNITTSEIQLDDGLELYTWHVIIDTPRDGRVVVEIVKATGDIAILPLRR